MTASIRSIVLGGLLVLLSGCGTPSPSSQTSILTSFEALRLIVEPVAGDTDVAVLLQEGVSPHAYAPRPSEMVALRGAELAVYAHPHVDGWMAGLGARSELALFEHLEEADHALDDTENEGASEHGTPHVGGAADPHVWNDPDAVIKALPRLSNTLCDVRPDECPALRRRTAVFASNLAVLRDSLMRAHGVERTEGRCFITAQPFMDQFLSRFGFGFIGPLSISADVEPSPTSLARTIRQANDQGCRHLIVQSVLENRLEKRLAAEQGWDVIEVDPLGYGVASYGDYLTGLYTALMSSEAGASAQASLPPSP